VDGRRRFRAGCADSWDGGVWTPVHLHPKIPAFGVGQAQHFLPDFRRTDGDVFARWISGTRDTRGLADGGRHSVERRALCVARHRPASI